MYTARKKIQKEKGLEPSEFEDSVAQVSLYSLSPVSSRHLAVFLSLNSAPCVYDCGCISLV
jgi:hypothetical protein